MADTLLFRSLACFFAIITRSSAAFNVTKLSTNITQSLFNGNNSTIEAHRINSKPLFSSLPAVKNSIINSSATRTSLTYSHISQYDHREHFSGTTALLVIVILVGLTSVVMVLFWSRYRRVKRNNRDLRYHYTSLDHTLVTSPCSSPEFGCEAEIGLTFKGTSESSDDEELLQ